MVWGCYVHLDDELCVFFHHFETQCTLICCATKYESISSLKKNSSVISAEPQKCVQNDSRFKTLFFFFRYKMVAGYFTHSALGPKNLIQNYSEIFGIIRNYSELSKEAEKFPVLVAHGYICTHTQSMLERKLGCPEFLKLGLEFFFGHLVLFSLNCN
jgi:hypothetical protein